MPSDAIQKLRPEDVRPGFCPHGLNVEEDLLRPTTVDAGLIWTFQTGPKRINGVDTG